MCRACRRSPAGWRPERRTGTTDMDDLNLLADLIARARAGEESMGEQSRPKRFRPLQLFLRQLRSGRRRGDASHPGSRSRPRDVHRSKGRPRPAAQLYPRCLARPRCPDSDCLHQSRQEAPLRLTPGQRADRHKNRLSFHGKRQRYRHGYHSISAGVDGSEQHAEFFNPRQLLPADQIHLPGVNPALERGRARRSGPLRGPLQ